MAAIKVSLVADVRPFVAGFKKGTESVEDLVEEVKDLADAGDDTAKSMVKDLDSIGDAAKAAQKQTSRIAEGTGGSLHEASGNIEEFKDEAKQNFAEVASSFSGDMAGAADLVQGTLGGLAGSLGGPLGLALGAASIALGSVIAQAQADAEKAEEFRLKAVEAVTSAFDEGVDVSKFLSSSDQVIDRIRELEESKEGTGGRFFWEEDPSRLEEWTDALDVIGRSGKEVEQVLGTQSVDALKKYKRGLEDAQEAAEDEADSIDTSTAKGQERYNQLLITASAYDDVIKNVESEIKLRDEASESEKRQSDAGLDAAAAAQEAAQIRLDAQQAVTDSITDAYATLVDDANEYATAEDGALDINRWLTYVQEHAGAVAQYQANLALLTMSPEDWNALLAMPEESRTQWVAQVSALPEEARQPFIDALDGIAGNSGTSASVAFSESFSPEAEVDVTADTTAATAAADKVATKKREAKVTVKADPASLSTADKAIDGIAHNRTVRITAALASGQAQLDLDSFIARNNGRIIKLKAEIEKGKEWQ